MWMFNCRELILSQLKVGIVANTTEENKLRKKGAVSEEGGIRLSSKGGSKGSPYWWSHCHVSQTGSASLRFSNLTDWLPFHFHWAAGAR
jgi:hypothetical protein